ncbi:MAG: hypothetical protein EB084_13370, partial [Proteobacteria bacterium]|nr:hypothetical protein [Pseudomonadota bacterium]
GPFGVQGPQAMQSLANIAQGFPMGSAGPMDTSSLSANAQFALSPEDQQKVLEFYRKLWELQQQLFAQIASGDEEGAGQTRHQIEQLYAQLAGHTDRVSAPQPQPEYPNWQNGGAPAGAGPEVGGGPGAEARDVNPNDFNGGTPMGRELASLAVQHATDGTGDGHHCYRNVAQDLAKVGINVSGESAYMAADQLARNSKVQEVKGLNSQDLQHLPPGAIVVWNRGNGHEHGHISIATGDGREASDVMRRQITNYGTSFRVFLPNDHGGGNVGAHQATGGGAHHATGGGGRH